MGFRLIRTMALTFIGITISLSLFSQSQTKNNDHHYIVGKFSYSVGGMLHSPAELYNSVGSLGIENKVIPNFSIRVGYDILQAKRTSINLCFFTNPEPVYKFKFFIPMEDLPGNPDHDLISSFKTYTMYSMSIGIMGRRLIMDNKYGNLTATLGYSLKYFPNGYSEFILTTSSDNTTRVLYDMYLESPKKSYHSSIQLGLGQSIAIRKNYVTLDLFYNSSFYNLMDGQYEYHNLKTSSPSYGNYKLSGNYLCLQLTYQRLR